MMVSIDQTKSLNQKHYLGDFEKFANTIHSHQKSFIQIQSVFALLLIHIKVFFQQIDDSIIVACEQTDQVTKQQHEAHVYHT